MKGVSKPSLFLERPSSRWYSTSMKAVTELPHTTFPLSTGGKVVVLNTGAIITPEAEAMLQALHSRSIAGISGHLEVLAEKGAEKFMSSYYVGYGHKSIGDCGSATLFIEGVSMLAAKAIQDWRLYSGQEASTRYIDFATQAFFNPIGTPAGEKVLETWREFYLYGLKELVPDLMRRFPKGEEEKQGVYEKAINARAFDIMRGFLPAGATTNLAWHGSLRQFADKLLFMHHHPLAEVREIAYTTERALIKAFPSSFADKRYEASESYIATQMQKYYFDEPEWPEFAVTNDCIDRDLLSEYRIALEQRPAKTELPKWLAECGTLTFAFLLDFGSFRDLQRHRAISQRMPLLTTAHGFEEWYLSEMPEKLQAKAKEAIASQIESITALALLPEVAQYYTAMGFKVANRIVGDLPALVYLAELRATRFVHPTLRKRAIEMAQVLEERFSAEGLVIHLDPEPDRFDVKRGEHDIVRKD